MNFYYLLFLLFIIYLFLTTIFFIIIIIDMNNHFQSENSKAIISGSVAGTVGYCSTLPLDYIKQHMQNNKSFSLIIKISKLIII